LPIKACSPLHSTPTLTQSKRSLLCIDQKNRTLWISNPELLPALIPKTSETWNVNLDNFLIECAGRFCKGRVVYPLHLPIRLHQSCLKIATPRFKIFDLCHSPTSTDSYSVPVMTHGTIGGLPSNYFSRRGLHSASLMSRSLQTCLLGCY